MPQDQLARYPSKDSGNFVHTVTRWPMLAQKVFIPAKQHLERPEEGAVSKPQKLQGQRLRGGRFHCHPLAKAMTVSIVNSKERDLPNMTVKELRRIFTRLYRNKFAHTW